MHWSTDPAPKPPSKTPVASHKKLQTSTFASSVQQAGRHAFLLKLPNKSMTTGQTQQHQQQQADRCRGGGNRLSCSGRRSSSSRMSSKKLPKQNRADAIGMRAKGNCRFCCGSSSWSKQKSQQTSERVRGFTVKISNCLEASNNNKICCCSALFRVSAVEPCARVLTRGREMHRIYCFWLGIDFSLSHRGCTCFVRFVVFVHNCATASTPAAATAKAADKAVEKQQHQNQQQQQQQK